jgi:hypothetical protein
VNLPLPAEEFPHAGQKSYNAMAEICFNRLKYIFDAGMK